jgi:hypothetical protein
MKSKKKVVIIIVTIFAFVTIGGIEQIFADVCEDLGLHYSSSSICPIQNKNQPTSSTPQDTILRLFSMRYLFNEGDPIVFVGTLSTKEGTPIRDAKITIKHDGICTNKTIGYGTTDKTGRFWILTNAKIWDKRDNLVNTHAEFSGKKGLRDTISESRIIVVYPVKNKLC